MNASVKEMMEVAEIIRGCQHKLWNSRLSQDGGIYKIGKFVVKSPFLCPDRKSSKLEFWENGESDNSRAECSFYENIFNFLVIGKQGHTVITNDANSLMIHKIMKISTDQIDVYPYIGYTWAKEERRGVPKETLSSLRFTLNSSTFVQYDYKGGKYEVINHKSIPLFCVDLPKDLNKVTEIRGVPFKKRIDFDSMIEEIIMRSGIRELSDAISQVTG